MEGCGVGRVAAVGSSTAETGGGCPIGMGRVIFIRDFFGRGANQGRVARSRWGLGIDVLIAFLPARIRVPIAWPIRITIRLPVLDKRQDSTRDLHH